MYKSKGVNYLIRVLSVKLLYVFQSVVELCKLIWSGDCTKFIFSHSVIEEKEQHCLSVQLIQPCVKSKIHPIETF